MRRVRTALALALLALALGAASAHADTFAVTSLTGDFAATNDSITMVQEGAMAGPYSDGGAAGGSVFYSGANGLTLNDLSSLAYNVRWNSSNGSPISAPYLRVFLNGDADDVIFDSTQCASTAFSEGVFHTFQVVGSNVRYDDDSCDGAGSHNFPGSPAGQQSWASVIGTHGDDVISGIYVTTGFAGGADLSSILGDLTVNADTFHFGLPGPGGQVGPMGAPGASGTVSIVTAPTVVNRTVQLPAVAPSSPSCKGDELRTIHAPSRRGEQFLSTRATLRGKSLRHRGRSITVDLRGRPEGNYNVRITSRYLRASGLTRTVKTTRNLSVVCA